MSAISVLSKSKSDNKKVFLAAYQEQSFKPLTVNLKFKIFYNIVPGLTCSLSQALK
jgi:hypothetical protein